MESQGLSILQQAILSRLPDAPRILLGLDFDGTLAPLAAEPALAALPASTRATLQSLAARAQVSLAIVSGRSLADVRGRVDLSGIIYAGNHGLEIDGPTVRFVDVEAAATGSVLQQVASDLAERLAGIAGALIEDKSLTLSIHYRLVAPQEREAVYRAVQDALAAASAMLFLTKGDMVYEVRPHLRWNKGAALRWIQQQLGIAETVVIYAGDDATDEDAFAALKDAITIKVGRKGETAARYVLSNPDDVGAFLAWIDQLLPR